MDFKFAFTGVQLDGTGANPRVTLKAQPTLQHWPYDAQAPAVFIELPLRDATGDLAQIAAGALQAASEALSSAPLQAWIEAQQLPLRDNPVPGWMQSLGQSPLG